MLSLSFAAPKAPKSYSLVPGMWDQHSPKRTNRHLASTSGTFNFLNPTERGNPDKPLILRE